MIIKISLKRLFFMIWICFWLICNSNFFLLPGINNYFIKINSYHNKLLLTILSIVSFAIYAIFFLKREWGSISEIKLLIFSYLTLIILIGGYQLMTKEIGLSEALSSSYYNFLLLACFLILSQFSEQKDVECVIRWILIIGTLFAIANIICFVAINYYNKLISNVPIYQMMERNRRLPQGSDFVALTSVLYFVLLTGKRKKFFVTFLGGIICIFELIFVGQVRMILLAVIVATAIELYKKSKRKHVFIGMALIAIICILLDFMINNDIILISSFLGEGKRYNSAMYRLVEIKHFAKYIFLNGWFGFGFMKDSTIHIYSITDIGIIGFISRFGLIGIIWISFFIRYLLKRFKESKNGYSRVVIMFLLICFVSLSPFDAQRITFLPLELLIINSCKYQLQP